MALVSKSLKLKINRREKAVHVEDEEVARPDGSTVTIRLLLQSGAIGTMRPTEAGELQFTSLARKKIRRVSAIQPR
jgi:hypothetical protein